jgi:hypothetical protein
MSMTCEDELEMMDDLERAKQQHYKSNIMQVRIKTFVPVNTSVAWHRLRLPPRRLELWVARSCQGTYSVVV